jgi:hypothetical protein
MTPHLARNDRMHATDKAEPTQKADPKDPIEPIEQAEPIEPIESTEPFEAIERTESSDQSDHFDVFDCVLALTRGIVVPARVTRPSVRSSGRPSNARYQGSQVVTVINVTRASVIDIT